MSDTQCGFKLYKKTVCKKIFKKIHDNGFAHDIEITLLAKKFNHSIKELPVKWTHKDGSKINIISDSFKMLVSIIKMKFSY